MMKQSNDFSTQFGYYFIGIVLQWQDFSVLSVSRGKVY